MDSRPRLTRRCRAHLEAVGEDYTAHRRFAFAVGWSMIVAGAACILHGLVPAFFTDTASGTIRRLHAAIEHREGDRAAPGGSGTPVLAALALFCAALPWLAGVPPLFALPLSLISLAYLPAYWWSELRAGAGTVT